MNIVFLDSYFEPEIIAYTHLEKDLLTALTEKGHTIDVVCPVPTRGISEETAVEYRNRKHDSLYGEKVQVHRFWAPREGKIPVIRAFRYFWCNIRTYQVAVRLRKTDVVFCASTPPTQGMLGALVAKKLRKKTGDKIPFIYNLQDIFPDSLVNAGLTSQGSLIWKIGRALENYTYKHADRIIVISRGFEKNITDKGVTENKIRIVSNWIDLTVVAPVIRAENKLVPQFNLNEDKFLVVYAGNTGAAQGADIILEVAKQLSDISEIGFVIFGGGACFGDIEKRAMNLENVSVYPLLPQERVSELYSLGNIALITCKPGTGQAGLPSKTWSIMACNTRLIASFDLNSDLDDVIREADVGKCVEPGNADALTEAIRTEYLKWKQGNTYDCKARVYALQHASKDVCVNRFIEIMCNQEM